MKTTNLTGLGILTVALVGSLVAGFAVPTLVLAGLWVVQLGRVNARLDAE